MKAINSPALGLPAGHYCHAVETVSPAKTYYISGQLPVTPGGTQPAEKPFNEQVKQVFANIDNVLAACGCDRSDLAQVRVYITDIALWSEFNSLYADWMGEYTPARCVVPVAALHYGCKLEIEAVAVKERI